jgi:hypothetical protein
LPIGVWKIHRRVEIPLACGNSIGVWKTENVFEFKGRVAMKKE